MNASKIISAVFLLFFGLQYAQALEAEDLTGTWQSFDDKTNLKKGQVKFYYHEKTKSYVGKIIKVTPAPGYKPKKYCDKCPKPFTGKKVEGMTVIWHLKPMLDENGKFTGKYDKGYLLDPVSGKIYRVKVDLGRSKHYIQVRGYLGVNFVGRTQRWLRIK